MSLHEEAAEGENIEFIWGRRKCICGEDNDVQLYESFTYDGMEYSLYDCVYTCSDQDSEPHIGKIVEIWEDQSHEKVVKIVWFFHPAEIHHWLADIKPSKNEIFLASGEGKGLFNLISLEAISGKCNVICTSEDKRNPQASKEELEMADYVFYRTFDVQSYRISSSFPDLVAGTEVDHFFNRGEDKSPVHSELVANLKEMSAQKGSFLKADGIMALNSGKDGKSDMSTKQKQSIKVSSEYMIPAICLGKQKCDRINNSMVQSEASPYKVKNQQARMHSTVARNLWKDGKSDVSSKQKQSAKEFKIPATSLGKQKCDKIDNTVVRSEASPYKVKNGDARIRCMKLEDEEGIAGLNLDNLEDDGVMASRNSWKDGKSDISTKPKQSAKEFNIPATSLGKQLCNRGNNTMIQSKACPNRVNIVDGRVPCRPVVREKETRSANSDPQPVKKRKLQSHADFATNHMEMSKGINISEKRRKISYASVPQLKQVTRIKTNYQFVEVTRRPDEDRSKWFKPRPWEERIRKAHETGTLVLFENLDPSFSSSEVEDIVWSAFNAKVEARMVLHSPFSSPHCGQAFVIFKTKDAAEHAISKLNRNCLLLTSGRPLVGRKGSVKEPSERTRFVGHLVIDKIRQKQHQDKKNAVSTSHCSQPNSIEYEMALEWLVLQEKSNLWWDGLWKKQANEIEELRSQLNIRHDKSLHLERPAC